MAKYVDLGDAYMNAGKANEALGQYQAAQKVAPSDPRVYRGIGNAYYWLAGQARPRPTRNGGRAPKDDSPHMLLGMALSEQKDHARALPELQKQPSLGDLQQRRARGAGGRLRRQR